MKKILITLTALLFTVSAFAQIPNYNKVSETQQSQWLASFSALEVDGNIDLTLVEVGESIAPKAIYEKNDLPAENFVVMVDENKVLRIRKRDITRVTSVSKVTVFYNSIDRIKVVSADVRFATPLVKKLFDAEVQSNAKVDAKFDVLDLKLNVSGGSNVDLEGDVRYLTLNSSTSVVEAAKLKVMSADVNASQSARVNLNVSDRIVIRSTTKAVVKYKGDPKVVRTASPLLSGDVITNN